MMPRLALALMLSLGLAAASLSWAQESTVKTEGSVRTYLIRREPPDSISGESGHTELVPLMRLRVSGSPWEDSMAELAYEVAPLMRDRPLPVTRAEASRGFAYRAYDIEEALYPDEPGDGERFAVVQNLDRAALHMKLASADLHIGRQAVAFGSARAVNPTDVIAPYSYTALAKEERVGVDAVRVKAPLGTLSELDMGAVMGRRMSTDESAAFMRVKVNTLGADITAIALKYADNRMAGLDIARSVGGASVWLETARTWPSDNYAEHSPYIRASAGADYAFMDSIYAYAEYHKNGAGTVDTDRYLINTAKAAYAEGAVYLLGRDYLALGITWDATGLLALKAGALTNLNDHSALLSPGLEYSASDDVVLGLGAHQGIGKGPGMLGPRSEFGAYQDIYYAFAKRYF